MLGISTLREEKGIVLAGNFDIRLSTCVVSYHRRVQLSATLLWKPQISHKWKKKYRHWHLNLIPVGAFFLLKLSLEPKDPFQDQ